MEPDLMTQRPSKLDRILAEQRRYIAEREQG